MAHCQCPPHDSYCLRAAPKQMRSTNRMLLLSLLASCGQSVVQLAAPGPAEAFFDDYVSYLEEERQTIRIKLLCCQICYPYLYALCIEQEESISAI